MGDFCDGELFLEHPIFSENSQAIQIIGYYDEVELVNPLGTRTVTHKVGKIKSDCRRLRPSDTRHAAELDFAISRGLKLSYNTVISILINAKKPNSLNTTQPK